jgi:hypothetical protein
MAVSSDQLAPPAAPAERIEKANKVEVDDAHMYAKAAVRSDGTIDSQHR